jgi:O-antigen/teichoic acid export membrane protein
VIQILVFGFLINAIAQASGILCIAIDKPEIMAKSATILAVLNIIISTVLIKTLGFSGAAWGLAISVNIATLYFLFVAHRHLGIRNISAAKIVVPYIGLSAFAGAVVLSLDAVIGWSRAMEPRPIEFTILTARALCFCCVYAACVYFMKLFSNEEIGFWKEKLRGLRQQA